MRLAALREIRSFRYENSTPKDSVIARSKPDPQEYFAGFRSGCPSLGLLDDPATRFSYTNPANYCHAVQPSEAVQLGYQGTTCLGQGFQSCPVYLAWNGSASRLRRLPHGIRAENAPYHQHRSKFLWGLAFSLIMALGVSLMGLYYSLFGLPTVPVDLKLSKPDHGQLSPSYTADLGHYGFFPTITPTSLGLLNPASASLTLEPTTSLRTNFPPSEAPHELPVSGSEVQPPPPLDQPQTGTATQCSPPPGWVIYTIRSGDSLFALSQSLGVSVETLRGGNCLTNPSLLVAGQPLYVPGLPAPHPTSYPTITPPQAPTLTPPQPTYTPSPAATSIPTAVPPTNTPLPPTSTFTPRPLPETPTQAPTLALTGEVNIFTPAP